MAALIGKLGSNCFVFKPTINTNSILNITDTSAVIEGRISNDGGSSILFRGVCWSEKPNPDILDYKTYEGKDTGIFSSKIFPLKRVTTYNVRTYAFNDVGISYGQQISFTTQPSLPVVKTSSVSNINLTSAISGGEIIDDGGAVILQKGVCWAVHQIPTIEDGISTSGSDPGNFISNITGLNFGTKYYVRAYATNSVGTSYGQEISFWTHDPVFVLRDADGNTYSVDTIGLQIWMSENLKTTKYNDTSLIPWVSNPASWTNWYAPAYSWYDNNEVNKKHLLGLLYKRGYVRKFGKLNSVR
ncbi:MAG: hypothetical protein HC906_17495, partial [Bacteroidales bacterium]|nr:hypothetical protein [Bacteroidales bacterium]